jgi:hypothetical protein
MPVIEQSFLILDDRTSGSLLSNLGTCWRFVADTVMGGVSRGDLALADVEGRPCVRLTGEVRLDNNGGFVQASLDLSAEGCLDARDWQGFELDVLGNGERYNLHLRTADTGIVWQSYRSELVAAPRWTRLHLPFADFRPYRIDRPLDRGMLKRIGLVAIGREMAADLCVARVALYR